MKQLIPLVVAVLALAPHLARAASFTPLGALPGDTYSNASGVSADGTVVVGTSGDEAFRWSGGAMVGLGTLPTTAEYSASYANDVSADGSTVVGISIGGEAGEAFRWNAGVMSGLGSLGGAQYSDASDISADGSVVVGGTSDGQAFRWAGGVTTGLESLPGGQYSWADAISADARVIVGYSDDSAGNTLAVRWTDGVISSLDDFPDGVRSSVATGVSADGEVVVGYLTSPSVTAGVSYEAFRWTEGEMLALGFLQEGYVHSFARAVSADGSVVVGQAYRQTDDRAFIWTEASGMQRLSEVLVANGATGLEGWKLLDAQAISPDGRWIVGIAIDADGFDQAFLADISPVPEPSTALLLGSALVAWVYARRRVVR